MEPINGAKSMTGETNPGGAEDIQGFDAKQRLRARDLRHEHVYAEDVVENMRTAETNSGAALEAITQLLGLGDETIISPGVEKKLKDAQQELYLLNKKVNSNWMTQGYGELRKPAEDYADATLWRSRQHLEQNREAYENQAVSDYNRAREADRARYPEPLQYGQTDQSTSETLPDDQDSPRG